MIWLLTQIVLCLFFTACIGAVVGWLLRGQSAAEILRRHEREWQARMVRDGQVAAPAAATEPPIEPAVEPNKDPAMNAEQLRRLQALEQVAAKQARRLAQLDQEVAEKNARLEAQNKDIALPETSQPAQDLVRQLHARLQAAQRALNGMRQTLAQRETRIAELEVLARTRPDRPANAAQEKAVDPGVEPRELLLAEPPNEIDDLQEITGIGPVLQRVLNRLGIYQYRQIARLKPENIDWVAAHVDWFPGRILRENWVQQAARLHRERYPNDPI